MHFTPDQSDFIEYQELTGPTCIPVPTVSAIIFLEGQGRVLMYWEDSLKNFHILELHSVGDIPNSNICLVSLGKLLENGAKIYGDGKILAPFVPGRINIGMYTLEVLPLHAKPHLTLTNTISYNIVH